MKRIIRVATVALAAAMVTAKSNTTTTADFALRKA